MHFVHLHFHQFNSLVVEKDRLCQLHLNEAPGDAIPAGDLMELVQAVLSLEVVTGQVDRDGQRLLSPVHPVQQQLANLLKNKKIQLTDSPVLFEQRNEIGGIDHPPLGVLPAHQRLGAVHFAAGRLHFGLQIEFEIPVLQRLLKQVIQLEFLLETLCERRVIEYAPPPPVWKRGKRFLRGPV